MGTTYATDTAADLASTAPLTTPMSGNPGIVGIPLTIAGALGLALSNIGYLDAAAAGAAVPIIMAATSIGLLITTVWAAALGQNATAGVFGVIFGFYASYVALLLGLNHNWFNIPANQVNKSIVVWLVTWLATIMLLTLTTLRLPWSYTLLLVFVDLALIALIAATIQESATLNQVAAVLVLAYVAVVGYLFVDVMDRETGGRGLPLGRPILG
jgi:succinate-acetate transporter protein